jgi:two-component system nitrate/nitrite response regulator NarL
MKTPFEKKRRLLLVDDHPLMREGIRSSLANYQSLEIVGEAHNGEEAVRKAKELMADVVLMDINMPGMNGLEATELLRREAPHAKALILTVHKNPEYVRKIIHCGARGYVLKDASGEELARAIELVAAGRSYFSPEVSGEALDFCFKQAVDPGQAHATALSKRELEVLKLVARGYSTKEIAPQLKITCRTVETYRERIMSKLGVHNIAGLTRFAISEGLLDLE